MPSQQSSFRGNRTAFRFFQLLRPATKLSSILPSKMPWPCTQVYSEPLCETPRSTTTLPSASTRWFPWILTAVSGEWWGGGGDGDGDGGFGDGEGAWCHLHSKPADSYGQQHRQKHSEASSFPHLVPLLVHPQSQCAGSAPGQLVATPRSNFFKSLELKCGLPSLKPVPIHTEFSANTLRKDFPPPEKSQDSS